MAEINAIKYFKAVNATLFTSGLLCVTFCSWSDPKADTERSLVLTKSLLSQNRAGRLWRQGAGWP